MSGTDPDLAASQAGLRLIALGIDKAHEELKDLGMIGEATAGRGFSELSLTGLELGHAGLAAGFKTFCERWEWGVRGLMQRGNGFASAVGLSAGAFHEQEQYVKDTIKIAVNAVNGNPHLTEDEVKAKDWDEIRSQRTGDNADYSAESMAAAQRNVEQTWKDTGYDVEDAALDSLESSGALDPALREAVDQRMRETFDPTQEAVDRAERPAWGSE
ncbi:hypothetical protein E2C00_13145 [Streptomyces sp. WAC05374]|uniref:hypothetical protein n=1 Tax=Streptomyces sp. WAC05374 TaxID=2487420 RepID=UPI000F889AF5|nr:hypothetical protein [Streptomyces sp. WAC05374]RST11819.1 hypothetical protein EF905_24160 [Streptomyces sp. WAC05374]TDF44691.1 hypothetical protein E2B92_14850 [Streptomyces sp. WAC05374]TDF56729.1 hypothetical protein E2C00_13145 [Streptomyces sp. WAC05374]TDF59895.1 hypothetical protein E2C02_04325 [Streptomyces sp. WAC05374]